jgi:WD40 repeat protein
MRQRFFPKLLIISLCLILCAAASAQPQSTYIPITAQNVGQVSQVGRLGNGTPRMLTFSPDGSLIAVATALGAWVTHPQTAQAEPDEDRLFEGQEGASSATFSPDSHLTAAGGDDGSVMVWETASGNVVARLVNHLYPVGAVAWSSNGKWLASGDDSGVVRIWNAITWNEDQVISLVDSGRIGMLRFDAGGQNLAVETALEPVMVHLDGGEVQRQSGVKGVFVRPLFAAQGEMSAWIENNLLHVAQAGREIYIETNFYGALGTVFFLENGPVAVRTRDSLWSWLYWVDAKGSPLLDRQFSVLSPDGSRLATFGNDGVIHLKDAQSGSEIAALHGHIRAVTSVAFSPDGRLLVSSSNDGTIQVWDATVTQDSGSLATLTGHNGGVSSVAFNAAGTLIASTGYDGTVRLWGIRS